MQRLRLCIHHQACSFSSPITFIDQGSCYCSTSARPIHTHTCIDHLFLDSLILLRWKSQEERRAVVTRMGQRRSQKRKKEKERQSRLLGENSRERKARNQYRNVLRSAESSPGNAIQYLLQLPLLRSALPSRRSIGFPCLPPPSRADHRSTSTSSVLLDSLRWTFLDRANEEEEKKKKKKGGGGEEEGGGGCCRFPHFFPPLNLFLLRDIFPIFPLFSPLFVLERFYSVLFYFYLLYFLSSFLKKKERDIRKGTRGRGIGEEQQWTAATVAADRSVLAEPVGAVLRGSRSEEDKAI